MKIRILGVAGLLLVLVISSYAQQGPQRAGSVRLVVPVGFLLRRGAEPPKEAQRDDPIFWQDTARTAHGGRLRIGLLDGSILNVGSDSQLQILKHDAQAQSTAIELSYGRMRAKAVRLVHPGSSFEVRTPVAVAGVVGTRFVVRAFADSTEVFCLEDSVRVRNRDDSVPGEVLLTAGEFTRVMRGQPPTPAAPASPEQIRQALEETDIPVSPLEWSRAEVSWPPPECEQTAELVVRAWSRQIQENRDVETPVDPELVSGTLRLGTQNLDVEAGRASLPPQHRPGLPDGAFTPAGRAQPIATKIWPPLEAESGEGWRTARAVLVGSAFYVLGPMGATGQPDFQFAQKPAPLLWQSSCGAGFLAPHLLGKEYEVTLELNGQLTARGAMNLIDISYRLPTPPTVRRGQETRFSVDIRGLAGLEPFTQGRPVIIIALNNQTPQIIGDLGSSTPGARSTGESITYFVGAQNIDATGAARLDGSARGRQAGTFILGVNVKLDGALGQPRTPLVVVAPTH